MGLFRSDKILHLKIRMPGEIEGAIRIMDAFGRLEFDVIEFIDLNKDDLEAKKNFGPMIKRCENLEIKINNIIKYANTFHQIIYNYIKYEDFINDLDYDINIRDLSLNSYFDFIENEILEGERKILDLIEAYEKIKEDLVIELEKKVVFEKYFYVTGGLNNNNIDIINPNNSLLHLMGIIKSTDEIKMNRMVLRASRGRAMITFFDFIYPSNLIFDFTKNEKIEKKIFIIFYPNEGREYLLKKLLMICDVLFASKYNPPEDNNRKNVLTQLELTIKEKKEYLIQAEGSIKNFLREICGNEDKPGRLSLYKLYTKKENMIYTNLNKCIMRENFIDGEVWVLSKFKDMLISILNSGVSKDESKSLGTFIDIYDDNLIIKPTYIFSNDFLYPFQLIVNTYGIPRYREINPAYFNIVTFPFLFGVMFGDIGHGTIIFGFSLYLIFNEMKIRKDKQSIFKYLIKFRYFLLLLGLCSIYCGLLYNEFLSIPIPIFKSCYYKLENGDYAKKKDCVYPIGMDPKWFISDNELQFFNSFKMKFSVIFGVFHMIFGICLKGLNDLNFNDCLSFVFEFIPQLIFMTLLFGYMIILIFTKWNTDYSNDYSKAPSIITQLINILIKKGSVDDNPLWGSKSNNGKYTQENFHTFIIVVLIILIPIMIFPKPFLEYKKYKRLKRGSNRLHLVGNDDNNVIDNNNNINNDLVVHVSQIKVEGLEQKQFIDFFINQIISIIEFVLSTVSNTASYLRLWALSLAHVQLTQVFFEKSLKDNLVDGDFYFGLGFITVFIGYFIFANINFFVLILMDFMECFLHTLRLHWVEFQNKFYKADGYSFIPYSFRYLVDDDS